TLSLAWLTKARCLLVDASWQAGEQYLGYCYTDIYPLWFAERLDVEAVPYLDHPVEYPVLTGAWMWAANQAANVFPEGLQGRAFLQVTMLSGATMLAGTFALLHAMAVPSRRLLWFAAAPTLVAYAFVNWDALPVLLVTAAIWAHRRGRDGWSGALAGLGAAAKLYPALLVGVVVLARARQRRWKDATVHVGAAAAAWLAVNLPVLLAAPQGWRRFLELSRSRPADHDSLYRLAEVELRNGAQFDVATLNLVTAGLFAVAVAVVLVVGIRRKPPEALWQLTLPLLIAFLLTSKVYSPQFSLWLLPLMALALPRLPPFLLFCAADLAVFLTRFSWLGGRQGFTPAVGFGPFAAAIAVRAVVLAWVAWVAVREQPDYLAGAPDEPHTVAEPATTAPAP
ncbi:MAG: glycosyltransferase 87 family protein, partial [Egibacteraceae bacterium]